MDENSLEQAPRELRVVFAAAKTFMDHDDAIRRAIHDLRLAMDDLAAPADPIEAECAQVGPFLLALLTSCHDVAVRGRALNAMTDPRPTTG